MADKKTTLKTKAGDNVYPNIIGDNMDNAIADSPQIKHTLTAEHKINLRLDNNVNNLINNSLQKPAGLTKTKLVGVGTNGQENIEIGDNLTLSNGKLSATGGSSGGGGSISVNELTDKNGTIASTQLSEINANPQNFAFKYNGKILLFTKADSTTYQYCNNITSSSDNNVMTTSTILTITLSTGVYTIAENVHNVVANSIHPANGGDLTNIQVGSKVYSIPSGGEAGFNKYQIVSLQQTVGGTAGEHTYRIGESLKLINTRLTPPSDYNDGLAVLLGTSCSSGQAVTSAVGQLTDTTGDNIYYVVSAKITKSEDGNNYYLSARANAINAGTTNKNPNSTGSYINIIYAWIYK